MISESDFEEITGKRNIKKDILDLLQNSRYGLNIAQITEQLELSRNTVKRYIKALEKETLIFIKEIGRSKICFSSERPEGKRVSRLRRVILDFFSNFANAFETVAQDFSLPDPLKIIKQMAAEMSKGTDVPFIKPSNIKPAPENEEDLEYVGKISLQFLELLNQIAGEMIQAEIVPQSDKKASSLTLRVQVISSDFPNSEFFFHASAGFYETQLRAIFGETIHLDVLKYQEENACCYFTLSIGR